jgi:competence protein ComEC
VKGLVVAVARHPAAFAEVCRRAAVLVSPLVSPRGCAAAKTVVDFFAVRRAGTHALYIGADGSVRVETVAAARGTRPWSMPARRGAAQGFDAQARRTAGLQ